MFIPQYFYRKVTVAKISVYIEKYISRYVSDTLSRSG